MKKTLAFALALLLSQAVNITAQDSSTPFEGEIHLTSFANYCDYINKSGLVAGGNGIHRQKLVLKGDKGKLIDETTGIITIWDIPAGQYVTFIDDLKKGLSYEKNIDAILVLAPRDTRIYDKFDQKLTSNTIADTGEKQEINGHACNEIKGTVVREQGGMQSKYGIKAYYDPSIIMPPALIGATYGLEIPGMPMKWSHSYDGGHVPMAGELSYFMEVTVDEIIPRAVNDNEFTVPAYKMTKTSNPMSMMGYLKNANKHATKKIEEDKKAGNQDAYSSFKTTDEWDY